MNVGLHFITGKGVQYTMKKDDNHALFEEYYHAYYEDIYKFCLVKLNFKSEYAEDCCQNVFLTLYRKLSEGITVEKPRAYLYTIAGNLIHKAYDELRKGDTDALERLDTPQYSVNVEDAVDSKMTLEAMRAMLTEEEMRLIQLRYEEGYSLDELAAMLHLSKMTLSKRLYRIRQKIRNEVKQ